MQELDTQTSEELYQTPLEEWLTVLSRLWTAYDKPLDPDRLALYQRTLAIVPMGLLELAIDRVIREHVYNSVPTVAQVWAAVRKELGNPHDIDQAISAWCDARWRRCVVLFGGVDFATGPDQTVIQVLPVSTETEVAG